MNVVNSLISSLSSCDSALALVTCASSGQDRLDLADQLLPRRRRPCPRRRSRPADPRGRAAAGPVGMSKIANVALPSESTSPNFAIPTSSNRCFGRSVATWTVFPSSNPSRSTTPASSTTSSGAARPASLEEVERVEARQLRRAVDAEAEARSSLRVDRLAVAADDLRVRLVETDARRRPRRSAACAPRPAAPRRSAGRPSSPLEADVGSLAAARRRRCRRTTRRRCSRTPGRSCP